MMKRTLFSVVVIASLGGSPVAARADDVTAAEAEAMERLRDNLRASRPGVSIDNVRPTPVAGVYEVTSGANIYYLTPDARYLLRGELIDLEEQRNLTAERSGERAHAVVKRLDPADMVVFEPANGPATHHITVFTDPTCGFCRRLHGELLSIVESHPVEVRYAMFPRAGTESGAADTLRNVWCADDPATAMTRAKAGQSVPQRAADCATPMDTHWNAAQSIGIRGTPYVLLDDDGPVIPGFRSKEKLLSMLGLGTEVSSAE